MYRQAFRSAQIRARPELEKASRTTIAYFSTSQQLAANADAPPAGPTRPPKMATSGQRSRAAASEINSLVRNKSRGASSSSQTAAGPVGILDVRSLPRGGLRGRGGIRTSGRGGAEGGAAAAGQTRNPSRGPSPAGLGRFSRTGPGSAVRGGGPGRRGGAPGAASRGRRARAGNKNDDDKDAKRGPRQDPFEKMDPVEQEFDRAMRFGTRAAYNPSLTLDSLAPFMPASTSTAAGRTATVMQNLSILGTADPVGVPQDLQAKDYAQDLEVEGIRFFADAKAKAATEEYLQKKRREEAAGKEGEGATTSTEPIVKDAEEVVRTVILDRAIVGRHEKLAFAEDAVGVARSWHLRAETYTQKDVETFEKKLKSLLSSSGARAKPKAPAKAQAKAPARA
ncbi:hypothetical protein DCS_06663 [Drechmeria coniospora]|uniref:Uncharacterized protein n=1 Tax=Drechmeria coniospora TaxID=98403 RepID=A0A151GCB9_DRECN|nr:hypothetical protein DCS_06663 [Drechmeria coniospora]KYK54703.1 hypothetical protein DCS_06663 [Drechmeria coniospora]